MRTTIDLPDYLYRQVKARAALGGFKVRELITRYLEQGLQTLPSSEPTTGGRSTIPVAVPATGKRIRALSRDELAKADDDLELGARARSARR